MTLIFMVRHVDSDKNAHSRFSSTNLGEKTTQEGYRQLFELSNCFRNIRDAGLVELDCIYFSPSDRAKNTADYIAKTLEISSCCLSNFDSIDSGPYAGKTEDEVNQLAPSFLQELSLYRSGLFSSYDIKIPNSAENVRNFEDRIRRQLDCLKEGIGDKSLVIVSHRSPITATLIHYARIYHGYPEEFYGYINLGTGKVSMVSEGSNFRGIHAVDLSAFEVPILLRELMPNLSSSC